MDYEKKYKKLVEAVKMLKETNPSDIGIQNWVKDNVPELTESEDEKIRKSIINLVIKSAQNGGMALHKWESQQMIAWLEKQGTPARLSEEEQNRFAKGVLTSCAMSFIDYLDAHKYEGKMCVSNGECEDIENALHNAMWDRLHRYYCKYLEKQGEQKPTWSEEDEKRINHIIAFMSDKERIKDTETMFPIEEDIRWLKSLKERYTWKPSDEQIKVCKEVYADLLSAKGFDICTVNSELNRLEEDLKKLKG